MCRECFPLDDLADHCRCSGHPEDVCEFCCNQSIRDAKAKKEKEIDLYVWSGKATNKYVCNDIFLYEGYNLGDPCPKCTGWPNLEEEDKNKCFCYEEKLRIYRERIKK